VRSHKFYRPLQYNLHVTLACALESRSRSQIIQYNLDVLWHRPRKYTHSSQRHRLRRGFTSSELCPINRWQCCSPSPQSRMDLVSYSIVSGFIRQSMIDGPWGHPRVPLWPIGSALSGYHTEFHERYDGNPWFINAQNVHQYK